MKTEKLFAMFGVIFILLFAALPLSAAPAARILIRSEQVETDHLSFTRRWIRLYMPSNPEMETTLNTLMSDESKKGLMRAKVLAKKNGTKLSGYQEVKVHYNDGKLISVVFSDVFGETKQNRYATYRTDIGREINLKNLFNSDGGHFEHAVSTIGNLVKNRGDPILERALNRSNVLQWSFYLQEESQSLVLVLPTDEGEPDIIFSVNLSDLREDLNPELKIAV